ncbi:uncharacterized protein Dwil_GK13280 [Drosophila willistoni]|uniref:Uncharacterized protein n=1 Tax=Drosophila willistoni TaxID=7260 RepID=B4NKX2_DROWI|nr:uncharacterized protein Dwil_GK13280 [Drosophila willistoni]
MNSNYIANALGYHGQPLQKIWDDERGVEDLRRMGLAQPNERGINYSVYMERQKFFTFQERAKRLKMHQFFARKAPCLYDREMVSQIMEDAVLAQAKDCLVQQPPYEYFLNLRGDKHNAWVRRMECLKPGDIVFASVVKVASNRLMVKPLCTDEPLHHYLSDIPIKAVITHDYWGAVPLDKFGELRIFIANDLIRCEIYNISADVERLNLGMIPTYNKSPNLKLGLCDYSELPKYYSNIHDSDGQQTTAPSHYEDELNSALEFQNPNYDLLFQLNGLQPHENHTLMDYLKNGFPEADYASELRQKQASQWAFRSVADGIEHFKNGQQVEAFQCLNKALNIDPRNVEGLVARGALYANRRSFLKGLQDFEKALVLNKYHVNARKYMGETLVALGRSHEEENRLPEAMKAYSDCLNILPQHEQARQLLDALQRTTSGSSNLHSSGKNNNNNGHSSNESSSSSEDSDDQFEEAPPPPRCQFNQPFYATDQNRSSFDAKKANEFKLDEDDTMSSVRKLIRDASKHKKAKKKDKKKKDRKDKKSKSQSYERDNQKDQEINPLDMLKKIDFGEAFRLMSGATSEDQLKAQLEKYFQQKHREESPPPAAPTMRKHSYDLMGPSTSRAAAAAKEQKDQQQHHAPAQPKLSFQIKKRPLQMDKFGLLRVATPLETEQHHKLSRSRSRSHSRGRRSKSKSPRHRGRSKSASFRHRRRSQSTSPRHSRRGTKSRSRWRTPSPRSRSSSRPRSHRSRRSPSRSRYGHSSYSQHRRSKSRSLEQRRRRTPSPFVPRRTPSPSERYRRTPSRSRYRRSRSPQSRSHSRSRSYSPRRRSYQHYASPPPSSYRPRGRGGGFGRGRGRFRWYLLDAPITRAIQSPPNAARKAYSSRSPSPTNSRNIDAGPTIEEVDEMIKEAQKERKRDIIHSDKNILKKTENTNAKLINNE